MQAGQRPQELENSFLPFCVQLEVFLCFPFHRRAVFGSTLGVLVCPWLLHAMF